MANVCPSCDHSNYNTSTVCAWCQTDLTSDGTAPPTPNVQAPASPPADAAPAIPDGPLTRNEVADLWKRHETHMNAIRLSLAWAVGVLIVLTIVTAVGAYLSYNTLREIAGY